MRAKVFINGRSQAIRLPKEFRVKGGEVNLERTSNGFLVTEQDPWEAFHEGCRELSSKALPVRRQPPVEKRRQLK
jgi:antitoxin VapB